MNNSRDLLENGAIHEGTQIIVTPRARINYRAEGGCYGSYSVNNNVVATVKRFVNKITSGGWRGDVVTAYVIAEDENGKEMDIELGVCIYSQIDSGQVKGGVLPIILSQKQLRKC